MSLEIKGTVTVIEDVVQVNDTFKKREFVLEVAENPQYPEYIKLETIQDKTELLDALKVGDDVTVQFNLKGRAWTDKEGVVKYFNSLHAWKIEGQSKKMENPESAEDIYSNEKPIDEIPF